MSIGKEIDEYTEKVWERAKKYRNDPEQLKKLHTDKCASCLAAQARSDEDREGDGGLGFTNGDVCMLEVRGRIAEEFGWSIY